MNRNSTMRGVWPTFCGLLMVFAGACTDRVVSPDPEIPHASISVTEEGMGTVVPGRLMVMFHDDMAHTVAEVAEEITGRITHGRVRRIFQHAVRGFSVDAPASAAAEIRADPRVAYVGPVVRYRIGLDGPVVQEDPPWGLDRIDQIGLPLNDQYRYGATGSGVTVYVIDTGIRFSHEEFALSGGGSRASLGLDLIGDGRDGEDCHGHGTHVAGTIGGKNYGVAKDVQLVSVRIGNCAGALDGDDLVAAVDWVSASHVHPAVVNLSVWGPADSALDAAVRNTVQNGVVIVTIAGNATGSNACDYSPARVPEAFTVASSNASDARAAHSNIGQCVDIFAPGEQIFSAWAGSDSDTRTDSGTSFAAPHVSGVAALYREIDPAASPPVVMDSLLSWASANQLSNIGSGSPNLLLYSNPPPPLPLDVEIVGPHEIEPAATCTWEADILDGTPPFSYYWTGQVQPYGTSSQYFTGGKDIAQSASWFNLRVDVSDSQGRTGWAQIVIEEYGGAEACVIF